MIKKGNNQDNYFKIWKEDLDISFNLACQKNIFRNCFFSIQDNGLIWFQYKLIHRLTDAYLYKIGLSETTFCRLCNEYEETLVHLFVSCQKSINLWTDVKSWVSKKANYGINYYPATLIFGHWGATVSNMSINTIIMTCKFYILKCARLKKQIKIFSSMKVI